MAIIEIAYNNSVIETLSRTATEIDVSTITGIC